MIHDFLKLEHKTFYMCHHAISLFLDAVCLQVPPKMWGTFEPRGRVEPNKPSMYYYAHMDTLGDTTQPAKRRKLDVSVKVEEDSSMEDSEEAEETEEQESGDEGFRMAPHTTGEEEGEAESQQQEGEEEEQHGGLQAQWKSTRVKFTPSKLPPSAHLVPQEALTVASPVGDVRLVGALFRRIDEGEPPAQRRVSLPQISLAVLESQVVLVGQSVRVVT